ncbi:hypothetical protein Trydic_g21684 [Trypoxylus dichotomus]
MSCNWRYYDETGSKSWPCQVAHAEPVVRNVQGYCDKTLNSPSGLENHIESLPIRWELVHDNDAKHTARIVKQWHITVLDWPAQNQHPNPKESIQENVEIAIKSNSPTSFGVGGPLSKKHCIVQ